MNVEEGKAPVSFDGYQNISRAMLKIEPSGRSRRWGEGIFSWAYHVFSWNLMCRAVNVSLINYKHFRVDGDHFTVKFAKHKGDQIGEGLGNVKVRQKLTYCVY
jgi:hypothetical protein